MIGWALPAVLLAVSLAPPANPISLAAVTPRVEVQRELTLQWKAATPPAQLEIRFSADDGKTWRVWSRVPVQGASAGTLSLRPDWEQFNWLFWSGEKVRLAWSSWGEQSDWDKPLSNPLRLRAVDPERPRLLAPLRLNVFPPPWLEILYVVTFLLAMSLFFCKARWDDGPRKDLSLVFNLACFACLASGTTFLIAFAAYVLFGLALWHRSRIIKAAPHGSALVTIYQWTVLTAMAAFGLLLVAGLVFRVRDLVFD